MSTVSTMATNDLVKVYLERIGFSREEAGALMERQPNVQDLKCLLQSHLLSVPFENLGQHTHPAGPGAEEVPRGPFVPSLDQEASVKKIVEAHRGGFCWEMNYAFAWLLRGLGYTTRMGLANVITPSGPIPGHLNIFVDGLGAPGEAFHVDPGFGDAPRVPLPVKLSTAIKDDQIGDEYTFVPNSDAAAFGQSPEHHKRFSMVLMRRRSKGFGASPLVDFDGLEATPPPAPEMTPAEPVYLLNFQDDLALDSAEFKHGIASVLADDKSNIFSQKRMTIQVTPRGYYFVGKDYKKEVRDGKEESRTALTTEAEYRNALQELANITL